MLAVSKVPPITKTKPTRQTTTLEKFPENNSRLDNARKPANRATVTTRFMLVSTPRVSIYEYPSLPMQRPFRLFKAKQNGGIAGVWAAKAANPRQGLAAVAGQRVQRSYSV
jgi:hypothetical protein